MCGVFAVGFFDEVNSNKYNDFFNAANKSLLDLNHRGPDNSGLISVSNNFLMGHTRLSINGLVPEYNQPYPNNLDLSSTGKIIFNGEIFNFKELEKGAKCDTSVVFNYLEKSEFNNNKIMSTLSMFNGMWAFIYYKNNKILVSRDRFGEKPLFYYQDKSFIVFSSETFALKSFLKKCIRNYSIKNIHEFPSASYAILDLTKHKSKIDTIKYYSKENNDFEIQEKDFKKIFSSAVSLRLISDVPLAFTLSGGLDSSLVVAQAAQSIDPKKLSAYCAVPTEGFSEKYWAEKAATEIGCNLKIVTYTPSDYIKAFKYIQNKLPKDIRSPSSVVHYLVFKNIKEDGFKVVLEGQGADEIFAGYLHSEIRFWLHCLFKFKFNNLRIISKKIFSNNSISDIWLLFITEFIRLKWIKMEFNDVYRNVYEDPLPSLVKYGDLVSMLSSIESRNPFLDHNLYQYAFNQNDNDRFLQDVSKKDIRNLLLDYSITTIAERSDKKGYELPWNSLFVYVRNNSELPSFKNFFNYAKLRKTSNFTLIYHLTIMQLNFIFGNKRAFIAYFKFRIIFGWNKI